MAKLIQRMSPQEVEAFRRKIGQGTLDTGGVGEPDATRQRKVYKDGKTHARMPSSLPPEKLLVSSCLRLRDGWVCVTIPAYTKSNDSAPMGADAKAFKKHSAMQYARKRKQRAACIQTLCALLPKSSAEAELRALITQLHLLRIGPGTLFEHDNLPFALKNVLDAVCAWIAIGKGALDMVSGADVADDIGSYDDALIKTGSNPDAPITLTYGQAKCEANRRLNGVEVRLWSNKHST